ncbi:MAG: hypothetical protein R6U26_00920 [Candidatus Undinarchaeales archaeon]
MPWKIKPIDKSKIKKDKLLLENLLGELSKKKETPKVKKLKAEIEKIKEEL